MEEEEEDNYEEELDENTRQFNFWTHQVHIFFVRKFFPAASRFAFLGEMVKQKSWRSDIDKIILTCLFLVMKYGILWTVI